MSVRFDASADGLSRARLAGAATFMGWFRIAEDRNDYSCFFSLGTDALIVTGGDGTTLVYYHGTVDNELQALSAGTWYHLTLTLTADNPAEWVAYVNGAQAGSGTQNPVGGATMYVGTDQYGEWLNGNAAYLKAWNAVLTADEIRQEMYLARPVRTENLHLWTPLLAHTDLADYGGSGNNWTASGTLATESGPPVSWGGGILYVPYAATGPAGQNAGVASASATAVAYTVTAAPGGLTRTVSAATASAAALDLSAAPGAVSASVDVASASAGAFDLTTATATNVAVSAAAATAVALDTGRTPGAISATVSTTDASAAAHDAVAASGLTTADVSSASATASAFEVSRTPGAVSAALDAASAVAAALDASGAVGLTTASVSAAVGMAAAYSADRTTGAVTVTVASATALADALDLAAVPDATTVGVDLANASAAAYDAGINVSTSITLTVAGAAAAAYDIDTLTGSVTIAAGLANATATAYRPYPSGGALTTPDDRIYEVIAEDRYMVIAAEDRYLEIDHEERIYIASR